MGKQQYTPAKGPSQRQLRVGEMIRHALAQILLRGDLSDPELEGGKVTITEAKVSPDLRQVTIYALPFGSGDATAIIAALKRHQRFLRGEIAKHVDLKYMPQIAFRVDETFDEAAKIDALLRSPDVMRDLD